MRILFAISILSFLVLLWAAVAVTRRIRSSHKLKDSSTSMQPEFSQYLSAAAEGANQSQSQANQAGRNWPANQDQTNSYDKATSTERG
jgi:flagellar hook-basal body complex protein FliE